LGFVRHRVLRRPGKRAESIREAPGDWSRSGVDFDGVIDFGGKGIAGASNPLRFARQYNDRGYLHPDNSQYIAMTDAVDLSFPTGK